MRRRTERKLEKTSSTTQKKGSVNTRPKPINWGKRAVKNNLKKGSRGLGNQPVEPEKNYRKFKKRKERSED